VCADTNDRDEEAMFKHTANIEFALSKTPEGPFREAINDRLRELRADLKQLQDRKERT
jgi:hypothetical protein